jgi:hypothetical protein
MGYKSCSRSRHFPIISCDRPYELFGPEWDHDRLLASPLFPQVSPVDWTLTVNRMNPRAHNVASTSQG